MDQAIILRIIFLFLLIAALGYLALRLRNWRSEQGSDGIEDGFRPQIGFSHMDGMTSLSLILLNESDTNVFAEEIEIFLSELKAEEQDADAGASCHGIQKIRQTVGPDDSLAFSLDTAIYRAAGEPQLRYSFVLSSIVRYRVGKSWHQRVLENYRVEMIGLVASSASLKRGPVSLPKFQEKSPDSSVVEFESK